LDSLKLFGGPSIVKKRVATAYLFLFLTLSTCQAMAAVVDLEVAMETVLPITRIKAWASFLQKSGFTNVQLRSAKLTDMPKVKTLGRKESPTYVVTGILAGDTLHLPGGTFKYGQIDEAKLWIKRLQGDGVDALTTQKGAYGLSRDQIVEIFDQLTLKVKVTTAGRTTKEVIRSISQIWNLQVSVDPVARTQLFSQVPFNDELQGVASGTAMAIVLKSTGLIMLPDKPIGSGVRIRITKPVKDLAFWPVGWESSQNPGKTAPDLFNELSVEIKNTEISKTVKAIGQRLQTPILFDYTSIAKRGISLDKKVNVPAGKIFYKKILDIALSQAGLHCEVLVDEANQPFLWISP
jgi:hypothetical protein